MAYLITYDIAVKDSAGRKRARKVRKICNEIGDRIQKSVYVVSASEFEVTSIIKRIISEIESTSDKILVLRVKELKNYESILENLFEPSRFII